MHINSREDGHIEDRTISNRSFVPCRRRCPLCAGFELDIDDNEPILRTLLPVPVSVEFLTLEVNNAQIVELASTTLATSASALSNRGLRDLEIVV